ncbi:hypothetical protein ACLOJK_031140 [Asimina triloba]
MGLTPPLLSISPILPFPSLPLIFLISSSPLLSSIFLILLSPILLSISPIPPISSSTTMRLLSPLHPPAALPRR